MSCPEIFGKISRYRRIWKLFIAAFTFKHKSKQNYSQRCEIVITFLDSARSRTCFDMSTSSTQNPCNRNPFSFERFREWWWMQNMTRYCVNEKGTSGARLARPYYKLNSRNLNTCFLMYYTMVYLITDTKKSSYLHNIIKCHVP